METPTCQQLQVVNHSRRFRPHKHRQGNGCSSDELDNTELGNGNNLTLSTETLNDEEVLVVGTTEVVAAVAAIAATNKARERHNLSDSYNNLFNGDIDTSLSNNTTPVQSPLTDGIPITDGASNLLVAAIRGPPVSETPPKSISQTENMYSNIPNVAATSSNLANNDQEETTNLHVYSNLIDERAHPHNHQARSAVNNPNSSTISQNSVPTKTPAHMGLVSSISSNPLDLHSTLLCDDLDLDDPVSASFVAHDKRNYSANLAYKTIVPDVLQTPTKAAAASASSSSCNASTTDNIKLHLSSANELSSNRLRILHDTTMIDTALDLDSLDDTTLANTSQPGLIETPSSPHSPHNTSFKV